MPRNVMNVVYYFTFKDDIFEYNLFRSLSVTYYHDLTDNVHIWNFDDFDDNMIILSKLMRRNIPKLLYYPDKIDE